MTTIYLIRHGQTDTNRLDGFNGCASNQPLNETGMQMAQCLTKAFAEVPLDAIYASSLCRAQQTAQGVCGVRDMEIRIVPDLRETDFGFLDGLDWRTAKQRYPQACREWIRRVRTFRAPGAGESVREVSVRTVRAFLGILRENRGKTVAIVAHGMVLSLLIAKLLGERYEQYRMYPMMSNGAYQILQIEDDGHFQLDAWQHIEHLREEWHPKKRHVRNRYRRARACVPGRFFCALLKMTKQERKNHGN